MKYQIVVFDDWFGQVDNKEVTNYFSLIMEVKRNGYQQRHDEAFLPVSVEDFFCYHCAICDAETMTPIVVFKVASYFSCKAHKIQFPLLSYLDQVCSELELQKINNYINERVDRGDDISYSGGWTKNPEYCGKGMGQTLNDIYTGIHFNLHQEYEIKTMTAFGIPKFKTDIYFHDKWGVDFFFKDKTFCFDFGDHFNIRVINSDLDSFSKNKHEQAKKYRELWDNRIDLTRRGRKSVKAA